MLRNTGQAIFFLNSFNDFLLFINDNLDYRTKKMIAYASICTLYFNIVFNWHDFFPTRKHFRTLAEIMCYLFNLLFDGYVLIRRLVSKISNSITYTIVGLIVFQFILIHFRLSKVIFEV